MIIEVREDIIPTLRLGTHFLPATKVIKEILIMVIESTMQRND